jgi:hypothetical protein
MRGCILITQADQGTGVIKRWHSGQCHLSNLVTLPTIKFADTLLKSTFEEACYPKLKKLF